MNAAKGGPFFNDYVGEFLVGIYTFAPATKMTTDAVWNGGMGTLAIHLERRKGKGGKYVGWRNAPRKKWKGRRNGQGKLCFPAAVTECPWPSLSCGHGLRSRVILRRHLSPNGLACHSLVWQRQGKAVWGRKHVTDGNGRRCRFTLVVSCIRRHFRLTTEVKKGKMTRRSPPFSTST